jgi:predicted nucleic acid-binding protein
MILSPASLAVIDSNLAVRAVLPVSSGKELAQIREWRLRKTQLIAPDLWLAETSSAIRQMVFRKAITREEGRQAILDIFAFGVRAIPSDQRLCLAAFEWAERLGQSKIYDGLYLALTEQVSTERQEVVCFWTADERLSNRARQVGIDWVRWVG